MSTSCNNASQRQESTEEDAPPATNKKYSIIVDMEGAKGRDAKKWSSRYGVLIHGLIPVSYDDWRKVDSFYKDSLWKALMEFDMNIDPTIARPILERGFSQYFRIAKVKLRDKFLKKDGELLPRHIAIDNRPSDIDKVQWEKFIDIEYTDKKRKQCKTNTENKGKNTISHTLGRTPYIRLYEELEAENLECKPTRVMAWKVAHTSRKTREVLPCAAEKYALIEAAEEKQKSKASVNGNEGVISLEDFERDALAEVFGNDKKRSYCRAISSTSNAKHIKLTKASKAITNYKENEDKRWKMEMQQKNDQMHEEMKTMSSTLADLQQCMRQLVSQIGTNSMASKAEIASHTEHHPNPSPTPSNVVIGSSSVERQAVQLLCLRKLKIVAKGHLGIQKICHGGKVLDGEKIVWIEDVLDPDEPLFDAPQNGHYTLSELVDGGFVVWPESRVRCL